MSSGCMESSGNGAVAAHDATGLRTIGSLFWTMCDEVANLRFIEPWHLLVEALREALSLELNLTGPQGDQSPFPPEKLELCLVRRIEWLCCSLLDTLLSRHYSKRHE